MRAWLLSALLLAGGCKKAAPPPPPPAVVEVRVVDRTPSEEAARLPALDVAGLTARAAATIQAACGLPVVDGGAGPGRMRLVVEVRLDDAEDAPTGKGIMRAFVMAKLSPSGGELGGLSFEQAAVGERVYDLAKRADRAAAWRVHAQRTVEDVVRGVGARLKLAGGDGQAIVAALTGSDEDLQKEAMRVAGERRERAAVPQLVALLKSEDRATRDSAIGALAAIGDTRAVRPLTEVARFRDLGDLPVVLDALSAIGGSEARAYLEFVASGHDNGEIRDLAKKALLHLDARRHDGGTTRELPTATQQ